MGDELDATVRRERGVVIAAVAGDIDVSTVTRLRECLFMLANSRRTHSGRLHAVCARPAIRRLLLLNGIDRRISLTATLDEALMRVAASRDAPA